MTHGMAAPLLLGEAFGSSGEWLPRTASLLGNAVEVRVIDDLQGSRWAKLIVNCVNNVLDTLTGTSLNESVENSVLLKAGVLILKEAFAVLDKAEIYPVDTPGLVVAPLRNLASTPLPDAAVALGTLTRQRLSGGDVLSSTLQSIKRRKPTEIDYLNGEITALGKKVGVPTPCNGEVVRLIHSIEETGKFLTNEELENKTALAPFFIAAARKTTT